MLITYPISSNYVGKVFQKDFVMKLYLQLNFYFQLILPVLLTACSAAKLDNTYLPPGASGAGGGPGLSTPFRGGGGGGAGGGGSRGGGGGGRGFGGGK